MDLQPFKGLQQFSCHQIIKSDIKNAKIGVFNIMEIHVQRHTNFSKQRTLLDGVLLLTLICQNGVHVGVA